MLCARARRPSPAVLPSVSRGDVVDDLDELESALNHTAAEWRRLYMAPPKTVTPPGLRVECTHRILR